MEYPTLDELKKKVKKAIEHFSLRDRELLTLDAHERTISCKLASYLQEQFGTEWDVDCGYNREGHKIKRLQSLGYGRNVYPDIIVHHRNMRDNVLVIEMKKWSERQGKASDLLKLQAFKKDLNYHHTLYLQLDTRPGKNIVDEEIWDDTNE